MFEQPPAQNEPNPEDEKTRESLKKIEAMREQHHGVVIRELLRDKLLAAEKRAHQEITAAHPDITDPDILDTEIDEVPDDVLRLLKRPHEELAQMVKEIDGAELLHRAQLQYEAYLSRHMYNLAWELAKDFLDEDAMAKAGRLVLETLRTEMNDDALDAGKRVDAAKKILDEKSYFKGADRTDDERLDAAQKLVAIEGSRDPKGCWYRLKSGLTTRPLPKSTDVASFAHPFAVAEIEKLLKSTLYRNEAARLATQYELSGFIDIEADHELFDRLTAKR